VPGVTQALPDTQHETRDWTRTQSGAFPLAIPTRLIRMFSVYDDTVLDPFAGVGTTAVAAMSTGRNSVSIDVDADILGCVFDRANRLPSRACDRLQHRIDAQQQAIQAREQETGVTGYEMTHYPLRVVSKAETGIRLYEPTTVCARDTTTLEETPGTAPVTDTDCDCLVCGDTTPTDWDEQHITVEYHPFDPTVHASLTDFST